MGGEVGRLARAVGNVRLAHAPLVNHWWQVPLYVSPRGLTTSAIPSGQGMFDLEFDFLDHELRLHTSDGDNAIVSLEPKSVSAFYAETMAALTSAGIDTHIRASPNEVDPAIPFVADHGHSSYDGEAAQLFWRQLIQANRMINRFRSRFIGKVSPVHFFWGSFDLACTRFSGRPAPTHPGGVPHCADWVMVEGYSHELSSYGFWPGGSSEGSFYAYAYPEPDGFSSSPSGAGAAWYDSDFKQFLLPYEAVRRAADPDEMLLDFLQATYEAAADGGNWDRHAIDADSDRWAGCSAYASLTASR